ncbi:MAG TPA: alpha/beta hydrolase [Sporosarcina psychrophila]|uniref:Alpha/beta hydrolase n=1 Tax=Sporosarcina psychrophila TaxID=1476 RepID=A0A921KD13_SPOPS|nr:alpha/beta hydrolase [Sporosarcina psychrophila]
MKTEKFIKTTLEVVGFPFTIANIYFNEKNKVSEIGDLVKVKDRVVHTIVSECEEATCTVILDAGLGCCSIDWYYIQPQLSKLCKVISFDRAGYGWSSATDKPYTSEDVVNDLSEILKKLQIKPPYILVGHSFGGLNMRLFASKYPDEVTSLILIDSVHENRYLSGEWGTVRRKIQRKSLRLFKFGYLTSGLGLPKILKQPVERRQLPEPYQKYIKYIGYHPNSYEAVYKEFLYSEQSAKQLINAAPLNSELAVTIISSNNTDPTWVEQQKLLSNLTNNTFQIKTTTNHSIHLENPELIIDTISRAVKQLDDGMSTVLFANE